jgi:hypothetical protein
MSIRKKNPYFMLIAELDSAPCDKLLEKVIAKKPDV